MIKVQVHVDDHDSSEFSHLAKLAGVSPPMTEADLLTAEQKEIQSRQHKDPHGTTRTHRDLAAQLNLPSRGDGNFRILTRSQKTGKRWPTIAKLFKVCGMTGH